MPRVRRYERQQVQRQQMPGVRVSVDAPDGAFGPPKPIDIRPVIEEANREFEREREKADQVALVSANSRMSAAETAFLYGEGGVMRRSGKDSFGAQDELRKKWQETVSEIGKGLRGERQKMAFAKAVADRWDSVNNRVQQHIARETEKYDADQTEGLIENERAAAINNWSDPVRVQQSIAAQTAAITAFGARHGASQEALEASVSKAVSATHAAVISQMLANDQDLRASEYFQKNKNQISGQVLTKITADLQEGSLRGESQRQTDEIMRRSESETEAIEMVKAIQNPKVRDEVQRRVEHEWRERQQRKRQKENDNFERAADILDAKKTLNPRAAIPPSLWNTLTASQKASLYNYAETVVEGGSGGKSTTNVSSWLDFLDLDETELADLTRSELETKYLRNLGKAERNRAITRWDKARNAEPDKHPELKAEFTLKDQVDNALRVNRVIGTSGATTGLSNAEKATVAAVEREAEALRVRVAKAKGKPLTSDEEQKIVDDVVLRHVFSQPTGWQGERRRTLYGEVKVVSRDGVQRVPMSQIPERRRAEIRQRMKGRITDDRIERAYAAFAIGDVARFTAILGEQ